MIALRDPVELAGHVSDLAQAGDMVVCLGAGNITTWAQALPEQLSHILGDGPGKTPGPAAEPIPFPKGRSGGGGAA